MKKFFLTASVVAALMGVASMQSCSNSESGTVVSEGSETYTFELNADVTREHVSFKNNYGFTVSADLYLPKNFDKNTKHIAVLVGSPYGGVKQQGAGLYAMELAKRGCVAVAFDHSFNGESSGEPRYTGSYEIFTEDYSAGIDYLGSLSYVDRNKVAVVGLGSSATFALNAAKVDKRIKALVSVSLLDVTRLSRFGMLDQQAAAFIEKYKDLSDTRWADVDSGKHALTPVIGTAPADSAPAGMSPADVDLFNYYGTKRGWHPQAKGCFTKASLSSFLGANLVDRINEISPIPVFFLVGELAKDRYMTDQVVNSCAEPKVLIPIPGATHVDLYDRTDMIPFDAIVSFFQGIK
ncbi:MAG: alpha/beta hydrolase [Paludibacteraceae bacterium]|nr:alpha/beta hydrolase [Paludibacteraceae bacterium]